MFFFVCCAIHSPKYGITEQRTGYKGIMRLTIRSFSPTDVGTYHCVSTNSLGRAEGTLRLYGNDREKKRLFRFFPLNFHSSNGSTHQIPVFFSPFICTEIKIHPGTSESDGDQLNIIGGELYIK